MENYTSQFGHLAEMPDLKVGQTLLYGDVIGIMGTTGQSKWPHLHLHVIHGLVAIISRLEDIFPGGRYEPSKKQVGYFADKDLFGIKLKKTTKYNSLIYRKRFGKKHYALDLVPIDRHKTRKHFTIRWNRIKVKNATVLAIGFDKIGYGYYAIIGYKA